MCLVAVNLGGRIPPVMDARRTRKPMNALQQLIANYLADHPDENYSTIAKRGGMSRSTVYSSATKEERRQTPHPDTIAGLAKGMEMPLSVVSAAAGDAAGYHGTVSSELKSATARLIVEGIQHIPEDRLVELERRMRYILAELREAAESEGKNDAD